MSLHGQLGLLAIITYFIGALPFGLLVGLAKGVDIRQHGSKNIGASNAGRVLGHRKFFFIVFVLDLLKSLVPMVIASCLVLRTPLEQRTQVTFLLWLGVGIAAILGHVFPVYLKFRGGKGVATSAGVVLGLFPYFTWAGLICVLTFLIFLKRWKYISLGSIAAAVIFPFAYAGIGLWQGWDITGRQLPLLVLAIGLCSLVIWRHRENIRRLRAGTENKIRTKSTQPPVAS
jgi:glycerol-3-phosphate acyltransferase PlsY